jgi:hypothetical protein
MSSTRSAGKKASTWNEMIQDGKKGKVILPLD